MTHRTAADKALEMTPGSIYSHGCLLLTRLGDGECEEDLEVAGWMCGADDTPTSGALVLLADSATGWAVSTALPAGTTVVTAQLSVQFVRRLESGERAFSARARVAHVDADVSFTRADLLGPDGDLVAMATMLGAHVALPADPGERAPVTGAPVASAPMASAPMDGELHDDGRITAPHIDAVLGTRLTSSDPTRAAVEVSALSSLANLTGAVHGGVLSMMAERAIVAAVDGIDGGGRLRPLEFDITYHRRIEANGATIIATADVVEQTRRLVRLSSVVAGPDGRAAAVVRAVYTRPR